MSQTIENLQRTALRLVFGRKTSYEKALEKSNLDTLKKRRIENFRKFAIKIERNPRFAEKWLTKTDKGGANLRSTEKYLINKSKFDRLRDGPLNMIRRILNEINA